MTKYTFIFQKTKHFPEVAMPTLILLDCGLSMGRLVGRRGRESVRPVTSEIQEITLEDDTEVRHIAIQVG